MLLLHFYRSNISYLFWILSNLFLLKNTLFVCVFVLNLHPTLMPIPDRDKRSLSEILLCLFPTNTQNCSSFYLFKYEIYQKKEKPIFIIDPLLLYIFILQHIFTNNNKLQFHMNSSTDIWVIFLSNPCKIIHQKVWHSFSVLNDERIFLDVGGNKVLKDLL